MERKERKMGTKKVIFVNAGGYGDVSASKGDYDKIIASFSEELEGMTQLATVGEGREKVATTITVKNTDEAIALIKGGGDHSLVFLSRSMIPKAREVKRSYPKIRVVVFTGLIPDDEVIIVSKGWVGSSDLETSLKRFIIG
jgi:hypothetical protein